MRPVALVGVILALLCVAGLASSWVLLGVFEERARAGHDEPSPLFERELPAATPLLTDEPAWGKARVAEQKARLSSYGWIDRERGIVHIPIERAMAIEAERAPRGRR